MARRSMLVLAVACAVVVVAGCSHPFIDPPDDTPIEGRFPGNTVFFESDSRARNHKVAFQAEYNAITRRMTHAGSRALGSAQAGRPELVIGLGLSGGGLRSNAFQLGLMSALHEARGGVFSANKKTLNSALDNIAYISSVSGGTWAAASMMAYQTENATTSLDSFFEMLNNTVVVDRSKARCASGYVTREDGCGDNATIILNNSYEPVLERMSKVPWIANPFTMTAGYTAREAWRELLLGTHLLGKDKLMSSMVDAELGKGGQAPASTRPFWIINATHSADSSGNNAHHFNFQITPYGVGTMADCGNTRYCGFHRDYTGFTKSFDKTGASVGFPPITVSHAMAMSGAVFPERILGIKLNMFEWDLPVPPPGEVLVGKVRKATNDPYANPIRSKYTLADGGHSENFGALALMERRADLVIISDAGFDENYNYDDYFALQKHARDILGVDFAVTATGRDAANWFNSTLPLLASYDPAHKTYPPRTQVPTAGKLDLLVYPDISEEDDNSTLNAGAYLGQYCFNSTLDVGGYTGGQKRTRPKRSGAEVAALEPSCDKRGNPVIYLRPPLGLGGFKEYLSRKDNLHVNKGAAELTILTGEWAALQEASRNLKQSQKISCSNNLADAVTKDASVYYVEEPTQVSDVIIQGVQKAVNPDWQNATIQSRIKEVRAILKESKDTQPLRRDLANSESITSSWKQIIHKQTGRSLADDFQQCINVEIEKERRLAELQQNASRKVVERYEISKGVKPTTGYMATYHYLNLNQTRFPRDKTFVSSYDRELIFAYFLLGKYMGEEKLVPLLKEYLSQVKQGR